MRLGSVLTRRARAANASVCRSPRHHRHPGEPGVGETRDLHSRQKNADKAPREQQMLKEVMTKIVG